MPGKLTFQVEASSEAKMCRSSPDKLLWEDEQSAQCKKRCRNRLFAKYYKGIRYTNKRRLHDVTFLEAPPAVKNQTFSNPFNWCLTGPSGAKAQPEDVAQPKRSLIFDKCDCFEFTNRVAQKNSAFC